MLQLNLCCCLLGLCIRRLESRSAAGSLKRGTSHMQQWHETRRARLYV